jgi:hypothetical protein
MVFAKWGIEHTSAQFVSLFGVDVNILMILDLTLQHLSPLLVEHLCVIFAKGVKSRVALLWFL